MARTTPAHLHFGIYTARGAVDPILFVDKKIIKPESVPANPLAGLLKITKPQKGDSLLTGTLLTPLGINSKAYLALHPAGKIVTLPYNTVKLIPKTTTLPAVAMTPKNNGNTL